jgi:hypothetical protein
MSEKSTKSIKVSFYKAKMTPLNFSRRVDIESPHWHDTRESDGSTNFNKNYLKKKLFYFRRFKE